MADLEIQDIPQRLKEGILLAERGGLDKAQTLFENYLETHPDSALALSYAGMLRAAKDGVIHKGLDMCQEAARRDPMEALCFLNLARAYLAAGDRFQCARAILRSDLWNAAKHVDAKSLPTPGQILAALTAERVGGEAYDKAWPQRAKESMW